MSIQSMPMIVVLVGAAGASVAAVTSDGCTFAGSWTAPFVAAVIASAKVPKHRGAEVTDIAWPGSSGATVTTQWCPGSGVALAAVAVGLACAAATTTTTAAALRATRKNPRRNKRRISGRITLLLPSRVVRSGRSKGAGAPRQSAVLRVEVTG